MYKIGYKNTYQQNKNAQVHVWIGRCHRALYPAFDLEKLLSFNEMKYADAFYFKEDRQRYIIAHALLRLILSSYVTKPPQSFEFYLSPGGKPFLRDNYNIYFNLSHTKDLITIAITKNWNVGVDVEKCLPLADIDELARKIMTENEYEVFLNKDPKSQELFFYNCWVRKEALVKAWGAGLDENLCEIPVIQEGLGDKYNTILTYYGNQLKKWRIQNIEISSQYAGAVCIEEDIAEIILIDAARNINNLL